MKYRTFFFLFAKKENSHYQNLISLTPDMNNPRQQFLRVEKIVQAAQLFINGNHEKQHGGWIKRWGYQTIHEMMARRNSLVNNLDQIVQ